MYKYALLVASLFLIKSSNFSIENNEIKILEVEFFRYIRDSFFILEIYQMVN
ncbi:hypothetical protein SDC9_72653 [bioreactor metagenome]|uniref:Uncharacterized protein n=1 Tax=bioreactor metagenome TaxID=1076179 RepID=A0A644YBZ3_9ZZZZ